MTATFVLFFFLTVVRKRTPYQSHVNTNSEWQTPWPSNPRRFILFLAAQAWRNKRCSRVLSQIQFWLVLKTAEKSGSQASVTRLSQVFVSWHAQFYRKSDIFGLKLGSSKWRSFLDRWSRGTKTLCTGLGKPAKKSSSHACTVQQQIQCQCNVSYLHCTSRLTLVLTVLSSFSAEHQYSPDWFLDVLRLSEFPVPTVFPSLSHTIVGTGLPMALQWNVAVAASITVWSVGLTVQLGGSNWNRLKKTTCIYRYLNIVLAVLYQTVKQALSYKKRPFPHSGHVSSPVTVSHSCFSWKILSKDERCNEVNPM